MSTNNKPENVPERESKESNIVLSTQGQTVDNEGVEEENKDDPKDEAAVITIAENNKEEPKDDEAYKQEFLEGG